MSKQKHKQAGNAAFTNSCLHFSSAVKEAIVRDSENSSQKNGAICTKSSFLTLLQQNLTLPTRWSKPNNARH